MFYNLKRRHSSNDQRSPLDCERDPSKDGYVCLEFWWLFSSLSVWLKLELMIWPNRFPTSVGDTLRVVEQ